MAVRPVFRPDPEHGRVDEIDVTFEWHPGFSVAQKQRSIEALHLAASVDHGIDPILEVSTKSPLQLGRSLSAFNLQLRTDEHGPVTVEAAYQGSKVFARSGQFRELYQVTSGREIKQIIGERGGERVIAFRFEGQEWPLEPTTAFYDWLYLRALIDLEADDPLAADEVRRFAGFTDIEFNPKRSLSCQARSCALFVALGGDRTVNELVGDKDEFLTSVGGGSPPDAGQLFPTEDM